MSLRPGRALHPGESVWHPHSTRASEVVLTAVHFLAGGHILAETAL
jgi:hypothetical protein